MKTQCPNCHQYKVIKRRRPYLVIGAWLTVISIATAIIAIGVVLLPFALIALAIAPFVRGYRCEHCNWSARKLPI